MKKKKKTTFVLCSPQMKRASEIRNFHVTGLQRRQNEQNSVMHVKFVVLSIKTYYFSAVLLPSPLSLVLLSSRNSATKKVHGDVTSHFSSLLSGYGRGGPDPAFPPLFRENPASPTFFISFPNTAFLSQKNTLKSLISTKANKCKMQADPFD